jgi:hypothetical protein
MLMDEVGATVLRLLEMTAVDLRATWVALLEAEPLLPDAEDAADPEEPEEEPPTSLMLS